MFRKRSSTPKAGIRCSAESTGGSVYNINGRSRRRLRLERGAQSSVSRSPTGSTMPIAAPRNSPTRASSRSFAPPLSLSSSYIANGAVHDPRSPARDRRSACRCWWSGCRLLRGSEGQEGQCRQPRLGVSASPVRAVQRATMEVVMEAFGMTMGDFSLAAELKGSEMAQAICDGKIEIHDVALFYIVYTVGHPASGCRPLSAGGDADLCRRLCRSRGRAHLEIGQRCRDVERRPHRSPARRSTSLSPTIPSTAWPPFPAACMPDRRTTPRPSASVRR